ncbi:MAG: hypothetical protein JNK85_01010 [Verrucomicrobiales bacterium]|nr:hypothetical protein [Verrucomicrobiales bacterium]
MGFLIYERTHAGDGVCYSRIKPLKFGGRDGLIAQHVRTLTDAEARSWKLGAGQLLELAGEAKDSGTRSILFEIAGAESGSLCLYELLKVHGSSRDMSTQLALDFAVVLDQEVGDDAEALAARFEIVPPAKPKLLGETLSLTGGTGGGSWKWSTPPMQLGAAIVHGNHGHDGGEPCPSCTCGRPDNGR